MDKFINFDDVFKSKLISDDLKSDTYDVVVCSDNRIVDSLYVLMYSLKKNCSRKIRIWILQSTYTDQQQTELQSFSKEYDVEIHIIDVDEKPFMRFNLTRLPVATYFYLIAHKILPNYIDRALVIDIDTIVLKDIADFYDVDFENKYYAAGNEYETITFKSYIEGNAHINSGLTNSEMYFNSGSIMVNLKKFRDENIEIENYLAVLNPEDIGGFYHDQLVVNRFAAGNVKLFPRLYFNCSSVENENYKKHFLEDNKSELNEVYQYNSLNENLSESIIHFCGANSKKPWNVAISFDESGKITVHNDIRPSQNKYIAIWWEYAMHISPEIFSRILIGAYSKNQSDSIEIKEYKKRNQTLETDLSYFKSYTEYMKKMLLDSDIRSKVVGFFIKNGYRKIGFYALSQVTVVMVSILQEYGFDIIFIMENRKQPYNGINVIPRNEKNIPDVDCIVLADMLKLAENKKVISKYAKCDVVSANDIIEDKIF